MIARPAIDAGGDVDIVQIRVHFVVRGWLGRSVCSTFFGVAAVWVGGRGGKCGGVSLCLSGSTDLKLSSLAVFHQVCNNLNAGVAAFALIPILSRASNFFKRLKLCELCALSTVRIKALSGRSRGATRDRLVSVAKFVSTARQRIHGFMISGLSHQRDGLCINATCSLLKDTATLTIIY